MADMKNMIITNRGHDLMAKMLSGTTTVSFTKIRTSSYDYTDVVLEELVELYNIEQETKVSKVTRTNSATVQIEGAVTNTTLSVGYYMRGLGLYATDPDLGEILYAVTITDKPDYVPPFNGATVSGVFIKLITTVSNSSSVVLEVDPAAVATVGDLNAVQLYVETHANGGVYGEIGIHGFRYFNEQLQVFNGSEWIDIETGGGGGVVPGDVTDLSVQSGNASVKIKFSDPADSAWAGTKVVRKAGAYPQNVKDGVLVLDNKVRGKYTNTPFIDSGLSNGTTYYYHLFLYSETNATNSNVANRGSATPQPFKVMGVQINLGNSNPETCITYTDDAVGMTPGNATWDEFFGHFPVLLKGGAVVGKLKKTDFTKFEDGSAADITSGNVGDAMVAFPRRGLSISTNGNIVTIKMTDNPDDANFKYMAHERGTTRKEFFYLGVYKGHTLSSKLRSLSGKDPADTQTIGVFRTQAQANGAGYENSGFYQLVFRQCMYLLKYKNLNSQVAVGRGYVDGNTATINTGGTETKGMDWGETTGKQHMKLFGLEDFWGNIWEWIDGIVTNSTWEMLTATTGFNDAGTGYINRGKGATANISGYMGKPQGTTETGFLLKEANGSETTHFCDYATLYASCVASFGGAWSNASYAGAFRLYVSNAASNSDAAIGGRLMYL